MSYEITIEGGSSKKLLTAGKYCDRDIIVTATGGGGGTGGGVPWNDVTFIDYDGTVLYSYTTAEAKALTEMPPLPTQPGLICQGWNYDLETVKSYDTPVTVGAMYITDDSKTRIYISLREGRTSPMLGCCPNGTVTVDWGDGTAPDVLTGASTSEVKWTPTHNYASAADYVISLSVEGEAVLTGINETDQNTCILRYSSETSVINGIYQSAINKIEVGSNVMIGACAFLRCRSLRNMTIPNSVTTIGEYAFSCCYSLSDITLPNSVTSIGVRAFDWCSSLRNITIGNSVTTIGEYAFICCYSLRNITIGNSVTTIGRYALSSCYSLSDITLPNSVTSIGSRAFQSDFVLKSITIPNSVTAIGEYTFSSCYTLSDITIPDSVASISQYAFEYCHSLNSITIPKKVSRINSSTFSGCKGLRFVDFTSHTSVPTLASTNAFSSIAADCQIRVPAALYDRWIAATNWSAYASQIVAV